MIFKTPQPFIGTCAFHWSPSDKVDKIKLIRAYISSGWIWTPHGLYVQPMLQAQKQYLGLDDYFKDMMNRGVEVLPCVNQSPVWLNGKAHWDRANDYPPIRPGADRSAVESYSEYAEFWFQFAARYGRKKHPESRLKVDPAPPRWNGDGLQEKKSGLGYIKYVEIGNEWDKWWKIGTPENEQYMQPGEVAAMLVACSRAIKEADPTMKIVMPGLTNFNLPYLEQMNAWFISKGIPWPIDVINVHHYSSYGNLPGVHPPTWHPNDACSPEDDKDFPSIDGVVRFAKLLKLETWVTEFGYDTHKDSPNYPKTSGAPEIVQAQWVMRSMLEYVARGVKRTYMFTMNDEMSSQNGGQFVSCGLLNNESMNFSPKPSYFLLIDMVKKLSGLQFNKRVKVDGVSAMVFGKLGKMVMVYWYPTNDGSSGYKTILGHDVFVNETPQFLEIKSAKFPGKSTNKSTTK